MTRFPPRGALMKTKRTLILLCTAGVLAAFSNLFAAATQTRPAVRQDIPPDLARQAKVSRETAPATHLAKVPNGEVRSLELEKEHGKLIYSFDLAVPGKSGIEEVAISAITGKVLSMHHETARDE